MLDTSPIIQNWRFCDQDLITVFFGGGGEKPEDWGDIKKEDLGDLWMGIPYIYNGLKHLRSSTLSLDAQSLNITTTGTCTQTSGRMMR